MNEEENTQIKLYCPKCKKFNNLNAWEIPPVKEFRSLNIECIYCETWLQVDFLVGISPLELDKKKEQPASCS